MNFLGNIWGVFRDFFTLVLPKKRNNSEIYKFAFIVHPRNENDIQRKYPVFKYIPNSLVRFFTRHFLPVTLSKITGLRSAVSGEEVLGYVISVLPTAHQMFENRELALKRITQACILAEKKGAKIIGLGGLSSSFSKGGLDLTDKVKVNITTGHAYTSYNVTQNLFRLVKELELKKEVLCIGIVGAAGSIGSTSTKILAREGFKNFILVDLERKKEYFPELVKDIRSLNPQSSIKISHQIGEIRKCDIIIAATNAPEALITSKDLKWGAVVIDDAQPSDVHPEVLSRKDVLVIEAGVTFTPDIVNNFNFGLKNRNDNFCCLAEVLILAANEWNDHFVLNRASLDLVDKISVWGRKLNFRTADFQNFKEVITNEKLQYVKNAIHKK